MFIPTFIVVTPLVVYSYIHKQLSIIIYGLREFLMLKLKVKG